MPAIPSKISKPRPKPTTQPAIPLRPQPPICSDGQVKLLKGVFDALKEEHGISLRQIRAVAEYLIDQLDGRIDTHAYGPETFSKQPTTNTATSSTKEQATRTSPRPAKR